MTGKSGSDVTTTAIIGILRFAYILAAELKEANAKIEDLEAAIADANERLKNNQESKEVIQSESPMSSMCDMASHNIIELNLYLVSSNYHLRSV